ncbi:sigma-70 family RNA polymerase sigma factor [Streptomyces sp. LX-29]|uniref:RNA polymerase sigma factor n=1 Tax=Streptomyces sp. LX-29 TaxID=2900152 RepID=UPI00240E22B6|nr:sigma-70 family RNA polymerase sigma factor [Streptomyces sp. LX-29]WFB10364.1 sigma-70 family RNA polymerase sigma factor [Streptomyces sp. LX-29]
MSVDRTPQDPPTRTVRELPVTLPAAFWAFHQLYHRPYLEYAHLQLGDRRMAGELVHATFMQLAVIWPQMMADANHEAYAWALLKERVAKELLRQGRDVAIVESAAFSRATRAALESVRDQFAELESALGLYAAISRLPERQFDAMVLRFVLDYPTDRAAHIMGVTPATVRSQLRFAKRKLAGELGLTAELAADLGADDDEE